LAPAEEHALSTLTIDDNDVSSNDEDADNAASALADGSNLKFYHGKYFNVPIVETAPFYCITRGRYIGVFSGW
jgi:apolipoprotein N-acyltransferase